jgi:RimJ/RimL family protein N-acetyltransferase
MIPGVAMMIEPIPGREVFLRRPEPADMEVILHLLNDPLVTSSTEEVGMPVSERQNFAFHEETVSRSSAYLAIVERSTQKTVGVASVHRIDWTTQTAHGGIKILESASGRGFATDAYFARNTFLLFRLGLRRLIWRSLDFNVASQRLAVRLGYRLEGQEREAVQRDGRWCDVLTYGLLRHEAEALDVYAEYRRMIVPVDVRAVGEAGAT